MITQERLKELLYYDPNTGLFINKIRRSSRADKGQIAGNLRPDGYREVCVDNETYLQHILAWFYITGTWPKDEIDHKNRIRDDNRWDNLREATGVLNCQNVVKHRDNTSGFIGVTKHKPTGKWLAQIWFEGRNYYCGLHLTAEAASAAYQKKKSELHTLYPTI